MLFWLFGWVQDGENERLTLVKGTINLNAGGSNLELTHFGGNKDEVVGNAGAYFAIDDVGLRRTAPIVNFKRGEELCHFNHLI